MHADFQDFISFILNGDMAPLNLSFGQHILQNGECDNSFFPPIFQCVSEDSVSIAIGAIVSVYTELRKTNPKERAWQLLSSHPRCSNSFIARFDGDVSCIWSMVNTDQQATALRYALVSHPWFSNVHAHALSKRDFVHGCFANLELNWIYPFSLHVLKLSNVCRQA